MLFLFFITTTALFYTPANYGFVPAHTTKCPSIKYYATLEEILTAKPTIVKKDSGKDKKKSTRLSKHKKRMLAEKNREKAYLSNLIRQKDGDYSTYITRVIEFYNSKLKNVYIDYMSKNTKNIDNLEHYVIILNDALNDEEMLTLKNKKHHYVVKNLSIIIEGFELLIECNGIGEYDMLSVEMMSKLHDVIHFL